MQSRVGLELLLICLASEEGEWREMSEVSEPVSLVVTIANVCRELMRARLYATCARFSLI